MVIFFSAVSLLRSFPVPSSYWSYSHTRLTHGILMAREAPPVCDHWQVCLSISHVLVECPTFSVPCNQFYPSLMSMTPCECLSFLPSESPTFSLSTHWTTTFSFFPLYYFNNHTIFYTFNIPIAIVESFYPSHFSLHTTPCPMHPVFYLFYLYPANSKGCPSIRS